MYCYHIHPVFFPSNSSWIPPVYLFLNFAFLLLKTIYPCISNYCFSNGWEIINWNITKQTFITTAKRDDYLPPVFHQLPIAPQLQMNLMNLSPSLWEFVLPE